MYLNTLAASTVRADSGNDRVFVADMYRNMVSRCEDEGMTLAEFKALLLSCHMAGLVVLTRCDLVMAYGVSKVEESKIVRGHSTEYHFVAIRG